LEDEPKRRGGKGLKVMGLVGDECGFEDSFLMIRIKLVIQWDDKGNCDGSFGV
jgi:hypothetical protein